MPPSTATITAVTDTQCSRDRKMPSPFASIQHRPMKTLFLGAIREKERKKAGRIGWKPFCFSVVYTFFFCSASLFRGRRQALADKLSTTTVPLNVAEPRANAGPIVSDPFLQSTAPGTNAITETMSPAVTSHFNGAPLNERGLHTFAEQSSFCLFLAVEKGKGRAVP